MKEATRKLRFARPGVPVKIGGAEFTLTDNGALSIHLVNVSRAPIRTITTGGLTPTKRRGG